MSDTSFQMPALSSLIFTKCVVGIVDRAGVNRIRS